MQGIVQDFLIWLVQFLAVSVGVLTAARIWTLHRKKRRESLRPQAEFPQTVRKENWPPWHRDPVMARVTRFVVVATVLGGGGSWLISAKISSWVSWSIGGGILLLAWGLGTIWLRRATRRRMDLIELRQFADLLELAALRIPLASHLETSFHAALQQGTPKEPTQANTSLASHWERVYDPLSPAWARQFSLETEQTQATPDELRRMADEVHRELSRQALSQARRVSRWGKYPLLVGLVPVLCFLLVAPLTEWTLDRITTLPTSAKPSTPPKQPKPQKQDEPHSASPEPENPKPEAVPKN